LQLQLALAVVALVAIHQLQATQLHWVGVLAQVAVVSCIKMSLDTFELHLVLVHQGRELQAEALLE
jgi:hypothetical protein